MLYQSLLNMETRSKIERGATTPTLGKQLRSPPSIEPPARAVFAVNQAHLQVNPDQPGQGCQNIQPHLGSNTNSLFEPSNGAQPQ